MKTLMIMAGGTGGHVYPAIAVADYLIAQGWKIVWLCTEGGMENNLIANKPYDKAVIQMKGVRGKGLLRLLYLPWQLLKAFAQSYRAIQLHQPNVLLGMGGFAAFPGGVVGKVLAKPLVIHEQNSVAGLTNKVLAKIADRVLVAFPNVLAKAILVGNPVRAEITAVAAPEIRFAHRTGALKLLVVGGSLGAQALNAIVPLALAKIPTATRPQVIHQAGIKQFDLLKSHYEKAGVVVDARAFIDDMAQEYAMADLLICRAGAMTVAELSAAGVASILVPFPFAVDDHQTTNAAYLVAANAAILIQQRDLQAEQLADILQDLSREQCLAMAVKARQLGLPMATKTVADICTEVAI